ncbi:hypothetical protein G4X40_09740 [Rhodococcus sp. D2-41]|uniref:Tat pathway signal protein n=1 Tax=Speluncibacter jeojiensis TaxID=2710754 RepID=A0A9X4LZN4_9ACTN|nr:hypothetical protein [Rhodococcus sp. D2-41]MDG3010427.1 hypothetical protein [Rhodococcus sp. D2-41]MDG3014174.1 hypothetical protein [Corynebacteriales bacterium D3-21]
MSARLLARSARAAATVSLCVTAAFGLAAPAQAVSPPSPGYLDLPATNWDGSGGGGLNTQLPTDPATLLRSLDADRAAGVAPRRYSTLLHQYWLTVGAQRSGIDLNRWDPNRGLRANLDTVNKVYDNYLRYQNADPRLYWAGMAGLAGASFASGFLDLQDVGGVVAADPVHRLGDAVGNALRIVPTPLGMRLPADVRALADDGPQLSSADVEWYQRRLLTMQKHIYVDMVPMHEAYLAGGMPAVDEMAAAGLLDDNAVQAWRDVAAGTPADLSDALVRMASREQNQIVADQWDVTAADDGHRGRVLAYATTVAAEPAIPGSHAPGIFDPVHTSAELAGSTWQVSAPLPAFNWADRDARWRYIADDLVPAYRSLIQDHPGQAQPLLHTPLATLVAQERILTRLPSFTAELARSLRVTRSTR